MQEILNEEQASDAIEDVFNIQQVDSLACGHAEELPLEPVSDTGYALEVPLVSQAGEHLVNGSEVEHITGENIIPLIICV